MQHWQCVANIIASLWGAISQNVVTHEHTLTITKFSWKPKYDECELNWIQLNTPVTLDLRCLRQVRFHLKSAHSYIRWSCTIMFAAPDIVVDYIEKSNKNNNSFLVFRKTASQWHHSGNGKDAAERWDVRLLEKPKMQPKMWCHYLESVRKVYKGTN